MKTKRIFSRFLLFSAAFLLTACYTNVIEYGDGNGSGDGPGGGGGDIPGGGGESTEGIVISPEEADRTLYADEQTLTVRFESSTPWTAEIAGDELSRGWLYLERYEGQEYGETGLTVYADRNLTGSAREAVIRLDSYSGSREVRIFQLPELPDGSLPEAHRPPVYSQIVKRIVCRTEGSEEYSTYEFDWNDEQAVSIRYNMIMPQEPGREFVYYYRETYFREDTPGIAHMESAAYSGYLNGDDVIYDPSDRQTGYCNLNSRGEITRETISECDPYTGEVYGEQIFEYWYNDGYLTLSRERYGSDLRYLWEYGNLISGNYYSPQDGSVYEPRTEYAYGAYFHPDCNIDLNRLYLLDDNRNLLKITDRYGSQRSDGLAETVSDNGMYYRYEYEFDGAGRVSKATETMSGRIYEFEYE